MTAERDKITIRIPRADMQAGLVRKLLKLAEERDRTVNYLIVEALKEYLAKAEQEGRRRA
jgi:predicted transcriptional regulator